MNEMKNAPVQKNKKKAPIIGIVIVILIAVIAGAVLILRDTDKGDPAKAEQAYQELESAVTDGTVDPYANTINFEELQAINPDIYAWITIPGTSVDYPVLTSEEDGYYLYRTYDGKDEASGSIFTDKYNSKEMDSTVTVLYGHTLMEAPDVMFGSLHKYMNEEGFMQENPYVYIYLPDRTLKYQIFSAVAFDDRYILNSYELATPEGFEQYITDLNSSMTGVVDDEISVHFGKFVITLSTCINEYPDQRLLVNAVLLEQKAAE